jgi:alpha-L-arabinofuranosidase
VHAAGANAAEDRASGRRLHGCGTRLQDETHSRRHGSERSHAWNLGLGKTNDWFAAKGDAVKFNEAEHYELLREADRMESLINQHWTIMGEYDRQHRVKLVVDEWGAWYKPGSEVNPTHLRGQQSTMRDAILAGLTLDTFNRHAEKVVLVPDEFRRRCCRCLMFMRTTRLRIRPWCSHARSRSLLPVA